MRKNKKIYTQRHEAQEFAQRNTLFLLLPLLLERVGVRLSELFMGKNFLSKSKKDLRTKARSTRSCSKLVLLRKPACSLWLCGKGKFSASPSPFGEGRGEALREICEEKFYEQKQKRFTHKGAKQALYLKFCGHIFQIIRKTDMFFAI
jgi:hypothetical protein